ncbi:TonB-dependent receptor [Salinisphaera orenii]|uniref:hypothetical protein n=1 Tax=Salinisphaera orenii TaxID=856731 RepID=UPI000DBE8772
MFRSSRPLLAAIGVGCLGLWTAQASAANNVNSQASSTQVQKLQQQINQLQNQLQQVRQTQQTQQQQTQAATTEQQESTGPKKKLSINGGVIGEHQWMHGNGSGDNKPGGDLVLDYVQVGIDGQLGNWTFKAEERFGTENTVSDNNRFLHFAQAAYHFGPGNNQKVTGGYFQVPFGNLPLGYQSFWGSTAYYLGFTDTQAAGLGYTYEDNGWRFDIDAFKNDDLEQNATYNGRPDNGYDQINGGNIRLGYTFDYAGGNSLNVSGAFRGGQLRVEKDSGDHDTGSRYAGTVAADAELGNWTLQGQFVQYSYDIPEEANGGATGSSQSMYFSDYGYGYGAPIPAKGQLYAVNAMYTLPAEDIPLNLGPIDEVAIYDNYQYLHSSYGEHDSTGTRMGDIQSNQLGLKVVAGPVYAWLDYMTGKNSATTYNTGPNGNDDNWHHRFNLAFGFYFNGTVVDSGQGPDL